MFYWPDILKSEVQAKWLKAVMELLTDTFIILALLLNSGVVEVAQIATESNIVLFIDLVYLTICFK